MGVGVGDSRGVGEGVWGVAVAAALGTGLGEGVTVGVGVAAGVLEEVAPGGGVGVAAVVGDVPRVLHPAVIRATAIARITTRGIREGLAPARRGPALFRKVFVLSPHITTDLQKGLRLLSEGRVVVARHALPPLNLYTLYPPLIDWMASLWA